MTEEIINSDGSRNWQANILLDNVRRLEQDSKQLTQWLDEARRNADFWCDKCTSLEQENKELKIYIESNKQQVEEVEMLVMDNNRLQQEVENLKDVIYYDVEKYRSALEKIREILNNECGVVSNAKVVGLINEVLENF